MTSFIKKIKNQAGNALFLILIAVALFAALSYAVTISGRNTSSVSKEQTLLIAGRLISNATLMRTTIMRMILINGCLEDQLEFGGTPGIPGSHNTKDPGYCNVFAPTGGGLAYPANDIGLSVIPSAPAGLFPPAADYYTHRYAGNARVAGVGIATEPELLGLVPISSLSLCNAINSVLQNPASTISAPGVDIYGYPPGFAGTYVNQSGGSFPATNGGGCIPAHTDYYPTSGAAYVNGCCSIHAEYLFFYVLIDR